MLIFPTLRFTSERVVWQEVPNETSLAFLFSGCSLHCKGCHSADDWDAKLGSILTPEYLDKRLTQYKDLISCVAFLGGEWKPSELLVLLKIVKKHGLKNCLYTGLEKSELAPELLPYLRYLKTGRWIATRGGLDSPKTNQRFIDLYSGKNLNHLFIKQENDYDSSTTSTN
ncbi:MAG: anaerobic ribonucleoside-triphosphate reductase activating protein [Gammaproteobacteria bacterium]|nr:anaerobic ribonucleoside-triphosphate reductase activating protein [Gammaproteobacteria bacterium]